MRNYEKELDGVYEAVFGAEAIERYTHEELIERILYIHDAEQKSQKRMVFDDVCQEWVEPETA